MNLGKKNKKENHIFHLNGPRPRFSAHGRSRPGLPPRWLARPRARRARPASGRGRRVAAERRRRRTGGTPVGPATPRAHLHLPTPLRSSSLCQFALSSANTSSSRSARSAARHRWRSHSGRASSPELAPSRPEHRLLLARLVLASVSHGKLPFPENPSPESWPSSPEHSAPWTSPLRTPSHYRFTRTSTARAR